MKTIQTTSGVLKASRMLEIRFSEVDSMKIVWHGSYAKYFEDAREAFGKELDRKSVV